MPKQPTSLNSLSRDLFAPCDDGQVLVKDSSQVSGVAPANNGAGGNPFDQDLNTTDVGQFAGLGIGTPGVAGQFTLGDDGLGGPGLIVVAVAGDTDMTAPNGVIRFNTSQSVTATMPGTFSATITDGVTQFALLELTASVADFLVQTADGSDVVGQIGVTRLGGTNGLSVISGRNTGSTAIIEFDALGTGNSWFLNADGSSDFPAGELRVGGAGTFSGSVSASGYLVGANPGSTGTVTTASLVGMTMNFENGIYMGLT